MLRCDCNQTGLTAADCTYICPLDADPRRSGLGLRGCSCGHERRSDYSTKVHFHRLVTALTETYRPFLNLLKSQIEPRTLLTLYAYSTSKQLPSP